jgi:hypothetical protein
MLGSPLPTSSGTNSIPDWEEDPPYGNKDSIYPSHDHEMIARAPILHPGTWRVGLDETLEMEGTFSPTFKGNNNKVWSILHKMLSATAAWQLVVKFTAS